MLLKTVNFPLFIRCKYDQVLTTDEKREIYCLQQHVYVDSDSFCAAIAELEDGSRVVRLGLLPIETQHVWTSLHVSNKEGLIRCHYLF